MLFFTAKRAKCAWKLRGKMRLNPAYQAILELQKKPTFPSKPQACINKKDVSYFIIGLATENTVLTMAGKRYQSEQAPHVSIYQYYKKNEEQGFSVFHYTWYGVLTENNETILVVLHVYYDRVGRYLYCRLKNRETNQLIQNISPSEEKAIQIDSKARSHSILDAILLHISNNYLDADQAVNQSLKQLDDLSRNLKTQLAKYKVVANYCVNAMLQRNLWSFDQGDPRVKLLLDIVACIEKEFKNSNNKNKKSPCFYSPVVKETKTIEENILEKKAAKPKPNTINKKDEPFSPTILQQLTVVGSEITENKNNTTITEVVRALVALDLLNKKFNILAQGRSGTFVDNELINLMKQINEQHQLIKNLFEIKAIEGDLESIKCLRPFISTIDQYFFIDLLNIGNIAICQYLLENFDICIFYLNYLVIGKKGNSNNLQNTSTLLTRVFNCHKSPLFLEMLLKNGANPNYYGETGQNKNGLLNLAIVEEREDFVRILLENGANPNPPTLAIMGRILALKDSKLSLTELKKCHLELEKKKPDYVIDTDDCIPLFTAIYKRNINIIRLLLEFGASLIKRNKEDFDALGVLTYDKFSFPDLEILKLLIAKGADINAAQMNNQLTALVISCQTNNLDLVKSYIELGANPNQQLLVQAKTIDENNNSVFFKLIITPLQKGALKGHTKIVEWLMQQDRQPITFTTAAIALAHLISQFPEIKIDCDSLELHFLKISPMVDLIYNNLITGKNYQKEHIFAEVENIWEKAKLSHKEKNYSQATIYFYLVLLFCEKKNRLSACYNLAGCLKFNGETEAAIEFYIACREHAPESVNGKYATKQLDKLLPIMSMGFAMK
jgi:ankyrin repeat protein